MRKWVARFSTVQVLMAGYAAVILLGTALLALPIATRAPGGSPFWEAWFTATSAACVTGFLLRDTYSYWTPFGQVVILLLVQVGGIGFMTIAISAISLTGHRVGLRERVVMQDALSAPQVGGIVRMTELILLGSLGFELLGTALLALRFCPEMGLGRGFYNALFHSVSAFCNAGFDLMGRGGPFSSLTGYVDDPLVSLTLTGLMLVGGLGFFVWADLYKNRWHFQKYRLQTKLVLTATAGLTVVGTLLLCLFEWNGTALQGLAPGEKLLAAFFQAMAPRSAGFNTVNLNAMSEASLLLLICWMFIGGASGSTAGGVKITTAAVLLLSVRAEIRKKKAIECFSRRIDDATLRRACAIFTLYLVPTLLAAMALSALEGMPLLSALMDATSAITTVGLSLEAPLAVGKVSQLILMALMFLGRAGSLTVILALAGDVDAPPSQYPVERITVG